MPTYIDHLKAAISSLEQELEKDPRYVALRDLRQVYAKMGGGDSEHDHTDSRLIAMARPAAREMLPETKRVIEEAERLLTGRTEPVPIRILFHEIVESRGCQIGGRDPVNGLSAILSRAGKFKAHGRSGWTLGLSELQQPYINTETSRKMPESEGDDPPVPTEDQGKLLSPRPNGQVMERQPLFE